MRINAKNLVAAGYRQYAKSVIDSASVVANFQKKVEDGNGTRYFINVSQHELLNVPKVVQEAYSFSPSGQFSRGEDDKDYINFTLLLNREATIENMESYFEEIFTKMGFNYYELIGWTPAVLVLEKEFA